MIMIKFLKIPDNIIDSNENNSLQQIHVSVENQVLYKTKVILCCEPFENILWS